jgi:hypothetical protein
MVEMVMVVVLVLVAVLAVVMMSLPALVMLIQVVIVMLVVNVEVLFYVLEAVVVEHQAYLMDMVVHAVLAVEAQFNVMAAAQEIIQIVVAKDGKILAVAVEIAVLSKDIVMDVT